MKQRKLPYFQILDELFRACCFHKEFLLRVGERAVAGDKSAACLFTAVNKWRNTVIDLLEPMPVREPFKRDQSWRKQLSFNFRDKES